MTVVNQQHSHLVAARDLTTFTFGGQKWLALLIVTALLLVVSVTQYALRRRRITKRHRGALTVAERRAKMREDRRGGLIMGADRRLSTSKATAVLWTIVVVWMLVAVVLVALTQHDAGSTLAAVLKKAPDLYLVLLGGPYAAAVLSKVSINQYTSDGSLKKSDGDGTISPADLISDDSGNTSVYDFQYVLFNLIAVFAVVSVFSKSTGAAGFPAVPTFLAILTGGSALTYTVSKGAKINNGGDESTTQPEISAIAPLSGTMGDTLTIFGTNLATVGANEPPIVQVGDYRVAVGSAGDKRIDATFAGLNLMNWPSGPLPVKVFTADGRTAKAKAKFTII